MEFISSSEKETNKIGKKISEIYIATSDDPILFLISGELAAGKTTLIKGMLSFFEINEEVTSPTFSFKNTYETKKQSFYHYDLYLVKKELSKEQKASIYEDIQNGHVFIEWPTKFPKLKKEKNKIIIKLKKLTNDKVKIEVIK